MRRKKKKKTTRTMATGKSWLPQKRRGARMKRVRAYFTLVSLLILWLDYSTHFQLPKAGLLSQLSSTEGSSKEIGKSSSSQPREVGTEKQQEGVAARFGPLLFVAADSDANRLYEDLMMTYNRLVRPVQNYSDKMVVRLSLKLSQLIEVNLKNQMMTTNVWLNQEWSDYKLKWDPSEYGGISEITVPAEQIWLPDIVLYNSAEGYFAVSIMTKAKVRHNGHVTWNPPAIFRSSCQIDVTYFPFDSQNCSLKFGSWTFGASLDLRHLNESEQVIENGVDLSEYYQNVEWDVMQASARRNVITYTCCPNDFYPDITFTFVVRRKPLFYTINLILPCLVITALSLLVFYLPSDSGEKVTLTISILVSLIFFLSVLIETIPSTSLAMPLLGKYLVFTMILITVSVCATVFVLNIHFRTPSTHSMSPWTKRWCIDILPKYLFMNVPQYQSHSNTPILPEQLVYLHNQAYGSHTGWPSAALLNALAAQQKQQQQQGLPYESPTTQVKSLCQLEPNSLENQLVNGKLSTSPSSLFLPYLQSEAARRLQMQRSRSSDRDQKSTSDNPTLSVANNNNNNNHFTGSNNNCDTHTTAHRQQTLATLTQGASSLTTDSSTRHHLNKRQQKVEDKKAAQPSFLSRLLTPSKGNRKSRKVEDCSEIGIRLQGGFTQRAAGTKAAAAHKIQQESSSSFENDYQHHNHFQARASVCSTNLWRIGPTRRCSMAVPNSYPSYYKPMMQPSEINNISGCVSHHHHHHHRHHHHHHHHHPNEDSDHSSSSSSFSGHGTGAVSALITAATSNLTTPLRAVGLSQTADNKYATSSSQQLRLVNQSKTCVMNAQLKSQQSCQQQSTLPRNYQLSANPPPLLPPPDLPIGPIGVTSHFIGHNSSEQQHRRHQLLSQMHAAHPNHFMLTSASSQISPSQTTNTLRQYPTGISRGTTSGTQQLNQHYLPGQVYNDTSGQPQNEYQSHVTMDVPAAAQNHTYRQQPIQQHLPCSAILPPQQPLINHLSGDDTCAAGRVQCHFSRGQAIPRSRSTDHRLYMYSLDRPYLSHQQHQQNLASMQKQQTIEQPSQYSTGSMYNNIQPCTGITSQQPNYLYQNHLSIGRALGQAYMQRLRCQPTSVSSNLHTDTDRPSRCNIQRNAATYLFHPDSQQQQQQQQQYSISPACSITMTDSYRMPRSKSQSSFDRRRTRTVGMSDCDDCYTLRKAESRLRLPETNAESSFVNTNSRCLCNLTTTRTPSGYSYDTHCDAVAKNATCECNLRRCQGNNNNNVGTLEEQQQFLCTSASSTRVQDEKNSFRKQNSLLSNQPHHLDINTQRRCDRTVLSAQTAHPCSSSSFANQVNLTGCAFQRKHLMADRQATSTYNNNISNNLKPPPLTTLGLMKLISEVDKAIENAMFIAQHIDNLDEFESVKENWKYIAMVIDRLFLIIFFFASVIGTVALFALVPWSYYTVDKPIDFQLTKLMALNLTGDQPYIKTCRDF